LIQGDCLEVLKTLPAESINCAVTSPPYYGLRDYGVDGQIGLEQTPNEYVAKLVEVFREVKRVLKDDGTLWLNLGDSYASAQKGSGGATNKQLTNRGSFFRPERYDLASHGLKPKDLIGIPWRVAFALQADGWYLRQDIIWHKPNPMPESVRDRCTKAHEYIFLLSKSAKYFFDSDAIKEGSKTYTRKASKIGNKAQSDDGFRSYMVDSQTRGFGRDITTVGRNKRSVWTVTTKPFKGAHFATFPQDLVEPCILAGCPEGGTVLDPFFGAGTVGVVAKKLGRNYVGIELNSQYIQIAERRIDAS
jgi:DNA modification methylase